MLENILYNSDILKDLFTPEEFGFLKEQSSKKEQVQEQIEMADLKRSKIVEKIEGVDIKSESIKKVNSEKLKEYVDKAEDAFKSINNIIKKYNENVEEFNSIEEGLVELIVKKDKKDLIHNMVNEVKNKILNFKGTQEQFKIEKQEYNIKIDEFLNNTSIEQSIEETTNVGETIAQGNEDTSIDLEVKDNLELRVSEREQKVYLPYTKSEVMELLENYPEEYKNERDVIEQEFICDISIYNKHPVLARFREAYSLSRNKEMKSTIDSLKFAMDMMFKSYINPTIIAAVKSQKQLETYIECLQNNKMDNFNYFCIKFEVNPI